MEDEKLHPDYEYFIRVLKEHNLSEVVISETIGNMTITITIKR